MKKWIGRIFMIVGILCIAGAGGLVFYNMYQANHAGEVSDEILGELTAQMDSSNEAADESGRTDDADPETAVNVTEAEEDKDNLYLLYPEKDMPTILVNGNYYIGTLEVPDLNLELPVMEEWSYSKLNIAPCRYEGSAYRDDMVICAHNFSSHFGQLATLPMGSTVIFTDTEGHKFEYVISWTETLEPTAVDKMVKEDTKEPWDLSLFTCNWSGAARNTYRCTRVKHTK